MRRFCNRTNCSNERASGIRGRLPCSAAENAAREKQAGDPLTGAKTYCPELANPSVGKSQTSMTFTRTIDALTALLLARSIATTTKLSPVWNQARDASSSGALPWTRTACLTKELASGDLLGRVQGLTDCSQTSFCAILRASGERVYQAELKARLRKRNYHRQSICQDRCGRCASATQALMANI